MLSTQIPPAPPHSGYQPIFLPLPDDTVEGTLLAMPEPGGSWPEVKAMVMRPRLSIEDKREICRKLEIPLLHWDLRHWSIGATLIFLLPIIIGCAFVVADALGYIRILP